MDEVNKKVSGTAVDRRVYGDFSLPRVEAWKIAALEHGLETKMQASPSKTKNATDIAMCIDAMDILHAQSTLVDTFVIVTNDGDFAPLAQRLRRSGKRVVAVGTGASLIASCDEHVPVDFARTFTPKLHTAAEVALLEEVMFDLAMSDRERLRAGDLVLTVEGDDVYETSERAGRWIDMSTFATAVDKLRPGWRRARQAEFINFRHMLESEPYRA